MGIELFAATFLRNETRNGVSLGRLLTLGRQTVYMENSHYSSLLASLGRRCNDKEHADDLFLALGAESVDVMDASNYEGANVIHDLNQPIGAELQESYDCVFDGGTLEHVFNYPVALKNCLEMVKPGGHFLTITAARRRFAGLRVGNVRDAIGLRRKSRRSDNDSHGSAIGFTFSTLIAKASEVPRIRKGLKELCRR